MKINFRCGVISCLLTHAALFGGKAIAQEFEIPDPENFSYVSQHSNAEKPQATNWDQSWKNYYFGSMGNIISLFGPEADFDQDGRSNHQEMILFTDPFTADAESPTDLPSIEARRNSFLQRSTGVGFSWQGKRMTLEEHTAAVDAMVREQNPEREERFRKEREETIRRAQAANIPYGWQDHRGNVAELVKFAGAIPLYRSSLSTSQAVQTNVDHIWPGGNFGAGFNGSTGNTIGLWEVGRPVTSHQDLSGRLSYLDMTSTPISDHANFVAGVVGGSGAGMSTAKGMSYNVDMKARDTDGVLTEIRSEVSGFTTHNHSYGYIAGWSNDLQSVRGIGIYEIRQWTGDVGISSTESHLFGIYGPDAADVDETVILKAYVLPVYSAGNDVGDSFANSAGDTVSIQWNGMGLPWGFYTFRNGVAGFFTNYGNRFFPLSSGTMSTSGSAKFHVNPGFTPSTTLQGVGTDGGGSHGWDSIPVGPAIAKNVLTVGSVDSSNNISSFSSRGPVDDGRIKPDIMAPGEGVVMPIAATSGYGTASGTSFSAPCVTGVVNMLAEGQSRYWGSELLWASTYKALLIHTATDRGNTGPDYKYGWGVMDAESAMSMVYDNATASSNGYRTRPHIKQIWLKTGETCDFTVSQNAGAPPVSVTIAWTDPEGSASSLSVRDDPDKKLVNDIDLKLLRLDANGNTLSTGYPYRLNPSVPDDDANHNQPNRIDNVEQVRNTSSTPVAYRVIISSNTSPIVSDGSGGQRISIILSDSTIDNYNLTITGSQYEYSALFGAYRAKLTWNSVVGQQYKIEKSTDLQTWTTASSEILAIKQSTTSDWSWWGGPYFRVRAL